MVSGIEAAGLVLAILPLLVNQLDEYVRGIEKIKLLRRYRREFADFSVGIGTQHAILLNNLEQALEGVVDDEHEVAKLISHPQGEGWEDQALKERLRIKLGRNYDVFVANTNGLWDLLERLCRKLRLDPTGSSSSTNARDAWKFRKILSKAVYDDLITKVDATNTILRTLIEQSHHHEETRKRRQPYHRLLQQYQNTRKHVEGLFKTIIGGRFWPCCCKEHHCVHIQLQTNTVENDIQSDSQSMFRMVFSNTDQQQPTLRWSWVEVLVEPSKMADPPPATPYKPKVRFDMPSAATKKKGLSPAPRISDLCSSLCAGNVKTMGSISCECDSSTEYILYVVKRVQHRLIPSLSEKCCRRLAVVIVFISQLGSPVV